MKKIIVLFVLAFAMTSCYNTRILVGNVKPNESMVEVNKVWNHHFLFGLVPHQNATMDANELVGGRSNYMVLTNMSFLNGLVGGITLGIYTPTQTKYFIPLDEREMQ